MSSFISLGTDYTLSKFSGNPKVCGAIDTLEGMNVTQRDLERWVCANHRKSNKVKYKVLYLSQGNPKHKPRLGKEWIEPWGERLGSVGGRRDQHETEMYVCRPESQFGLHQKQHKQQFEGSLSPSALMEPCLESCVLLCGPQHKNMDLLK